MCENANKCELCSNKSGIVSLVYTRENGCSVGKWMCSRCEKKHQDILKKETEVYEKAYGKI